VAVVIANAGQESDAVGDLGVVPEVQKSLPSSGTSNVITGIIHDPTYEAN